MSSGLIDHLNQPLAQALDLFLQLCNAPSTADLGQRRDFRRSEYSRLASRASPLMFR
jgi:hypothetical protein